MFSLNGVALDDDTRDWIVRDGTEPLARIDVELTSLTVAGRDGVVSLPRRRVLAPTFPLVVETPKTGLPALRSLFRSPTLVLTDDTLPGLEVVVELVGLSPNGIGDADEVVELTAILRIPGVYWRDDADSTSDPAAIGSGSVVVDVLPDLSAPVRDAVVRVKGGITNVVVTDSAGSFFGYAEALPSGSFLRFDSATGRAWVTSSDTWSGGTEVTGLINTGPGAYPLELVPYFTDPDERVARLTVTSSARTGSPALEVRGRRAYEV